MLTKTRIHLVSTLDVIFEKQKKTKRTLVASCFLGAFPPVDLRAVCLVRAIWNLNSIIRQTIQIKEKKEGKKKNSELKQESRKTNRYCRKANQKTEQFSLFSSPIFKLKAKSEKKKCCTLLHIYQLTSSVLMKKGHQF